jgi:putative ATP-binding cassette transporter
VLRLLELVFRWNRRQMLAGAALSLVGSAANAVMLALISAAIAGDKRRLALFAACALVALACRLGSQSLLLRLSQRRIFSIRLELAKALLRTPLRRIEETGLPTLQTALTDDILRINLALDLVPRAITHAALIAGCLVYLAVLSTSALLFVVAVLASGLAVHAFIVRLSTPDLIAVKEAQTRLFGLVSGLIFGLKELKLSSRRRNAYLSEGLDPAAATYSRHASRFDHLGLLSMATGYAFTSGLVGTLAFVWTGDAKVVAGYVVTLLFMQSAVEGLVSMTGSFSHAANLLDRLDAVGLVVRSPETGKPADIVLPPAWKSLSLRDVTYSYRDADARTFTLGPVSIELAPAEIVFLVGGNGSGKSSFAKIITGLYHADSGRISVDGEEVEVASSSWYREMFTAIFADFYLFKRLYGTDVSAAREQTEGYLRSLGLAEKVTITNNEFSTIDLSTGQRKRLALLVAYLEDRPICLFDEWAADQDPAYKHTFYRELLPALRERGKCVIVISHDDRYFDIADRVIKLEDGKISSVSVNVPRSQT